MIHYETEFQSLIGRLRTMTQLERTPRDFVSFNPS